MQALYEKRSFIVLVEVLYLVVLFALGLLYLTNAGNWLHVALPTSLGGLPIGVPWFGALGAVIISLSGAFDHRLDWDSSWNLWHVTRPLIGISLAIISWLIFQAGILAVGTSPATLTNTSSVVTAPTNFLFYLIAFVVGYREQVFRELIKRVADVILSPADPPRQTSGSGSAINAVYPRLGKVEGGDTVTITGTGLAGTTAVTFGSNAAPTLHVDSDVQITAITPAGTAGTRKITLVTGTGSLPAGTFTYSL